MGLPSALRRLASFTIVAETITQFICFQLEVCICNGTPRSVSVRESNSSGSAILNLYLEIDLPQKKCLSVIKLDTTVAQFSVNFAHLLRREVEIWLCICFSRPNIWLIKAQGLVHQTKIHANLVRFSGVHLVFHVFHDTWRSNKELLVHIGMQCSDYAPLSCPFMASN